MNDRGRLLREVMFTTGTSQSELSRVSGVHQPSISQFLSGKVSLSDEQLDRLLSCMGHRLEVVRTSSEPELTRSERRSWLLHRRLSSLLDTTRSPSGCRPSSATSSGSARRDRPAPPAEPGNWCSLVEHRDLLGIKRVLTGLDRDSIEMREVSPMGGLLPQHDRHDVLAQAG